MNMKNKTALVTGGSSGIGKAIVLGLAKTGCHVAFTYNSKQQEAEEVVNEVQRLGVRGLAIKADFRSETDIAPLFDQLKKEFQSLDILVNNAGVNWPRELFDTDVWREVFQVNLFSAVACTEQAIKLMPEGGKILNISSIYADGKVCWRGLPAYGASKAAISHFTQTLAKNLAPKILVNAIAPGYVKTPIWKDTTEAEFEASGKEQLIERMIRPEEIADMSIAVISSDAMTGEVVVVDGGISLKTV